jgi:hypothetical protein
VERSDFFRYLVLLRHGGVYADIDTESRIPIDSLVRDSDTLVVGWENEWATQTIAINHHFVRRRQVNWRSLMLIELVLVFGFLPTCSRVTHKWQ